VDTDVLEIDTARRQIVDLTDAVRAFCGAHRNGLCNIFVPHATAGVAIIETGAGSATPTAHRGMAPTMCCPRWLHRR
jgi:thiamine phosphate synthase YjbQ (UPF0047 family)